MPLSPDAETATPDQVPKRATAAVVVLLSWAIRLLAALPDRLLLLVFGRPPDEATGLRMDAWAMSKITDLIEKDPFSYTAEQARLEAEVMAGAAGAPGRPTCETEDFDLETDRGALRARLYRPGEAPDPGPMLVYLHGGGWVVGSIESHGPSCQELAVRTGIRVLSLEYSLAPEKPFPAAADDTLAAWQAVVDDPGRFRADRGRIGVGGDSAGGNLAAVLCQDLSRLGLSQPAVQALVYPVTDAERRSPSYREFAAGYFLTARTMDWYIENYLAGQPAGQTRVSPLLCDDLSGLAPAYVATALADPLRDEGEAYAARLAEAGVQVRLDRMPLVHGWFNATALHSADAAFDVLAAAITGYLGPADD